MNIREHIAILVEKHPNLWLPSHDDYHDKDVRAATWNKIVDLLLERGIAADLDDVKAKWKAMRSGYMKCRKGKSGQAATCTGIFRYLTFLDQAEVDAPRVSNLNLSDEEHVNDENDFPSTSSQYESTNRKRPVEEIEIPLLGQPSEKRKTHTPKRSRMVDMCDEDRGALRDAINTVKERVEAVRKNDKYDTFGIFVAQNLRDMGEVKAQEKIHVIVTSLVTEVRHVTTPEEFRQCVEEAYRSKSSLPIQVVKHYEDNVREPSPEE
ncbi:unnamed protein product [Cylicocyclus nassatus]|uniref:MADF domain-containing protein n=1 Tax=Cylicocyclus nassatus TaxID=53992 RepID=A0AA36H8W3_CYLNA|nr:unnamed protein product [Cylicocyclus nassatus]